MTHYTPDELAAVRAQHAAQYKKATPKRTGKTPEAKVNEKIDKYLKSLTPRPIVTRANAGAWKDDSGHTIMGAKAGTSDKVCLFPGGFWVGIETKATTSQRDAQERFQARVEALGGLYILARSVVDVRAALVARFGEEVVEQWEAKR